jgi:uncharacterized protein Yka (UPF0111/DUF47 family)
MNPARRWLLPAAPDVLGMVRDQAAVTSEGMDALVAWAGGADATAADRVRAFEHRADKCKRRVREALTEALITPLEPEDLFELSKGLDDVMNHAKDTVREAEVMHTDPDAAVAAMAEQLSAGVRHLRDAFAALPGHSHDATAAADAAVKSQRRLEHAYRAGMSALVDVEDIREITARREIYRRLSRTSDLLVEVAERVWYAVLKAS